MLFFNFCQILTLFIAVTYGQEFFQNSEKRNPCQIPDVLAIENLLSRLSANSSANEDTELTEAGNLLKKCDWNNVAIDFHDLQNDTIKHCLIPSVRLIALTIEKFIQREKSEQSIQISTQSINMNISSDDKFLKLSSTEETLKKSSEILTTPSTTEYLTTNKNKETPVTTGRGEVEFTEAYITLKNNNNDNKIVETSNTFSDLKIGNLEKIISTNTTEKVNYVSLSTIAENSEGSRKTFFDVTEKSTNLNILTTTTEQINEIKNQTEINNVRNTPILKKTSETDDNSVTELNISETFTDALPIFELINITTIAPENPELTQKTYSTDEATSEVSLKIVVNSKNDTEYPQKAINSVKKGKYISFDILLPSDDDENSESEITTTNFSKILKESSTIRSTNLIKITTAPTEYDVTELPSILRNNGSISSVDQNFYDTTTKYELKLENSAIFSPSWRPNLENSTELQRKISTLTNVQYETSTSTTSDPNPTKPDDLKHLLSDNSNILFTFAPKLLNLTTNPDLSSTKPDLNLTNPDMDLTKLNFSSTEPDFNTTKPGFNSTKTNLNSTNPEDFKLLPDKVFSTTVMEYEYDLCTDDPETINPNVGPVLFSADRIIDVTNQTSGYLHSQKDPSHNLSPALSLGPNLPILPTHHIASTQVSANNPVIYFMPHPYNPFVYYPIPFRSVTTNNNNNKGKNDSKSLEFKRLVKLLSMLDLDYKSEKTTPKSLLKI